MAKILHNQKSVGVTQFSKLPSGTVARIRKEEPPRIIIRSPSGLTVVRSSRTDSTVNWKDYTAPLLGFDVATGEPIVFDYQVVVLPDQDQLVLTNGDGE